MKTKNLLKIFVPITLILAAGLLILLGFGVIGPKKIGGQVSYPVIADLNGDGFKEIILVCSKQDGKDYVSVKKSDATDYFEYELEGKASNPVVADINGPKIVISSLKTNNVKVYVIDGNGNLYCSYESPDGKDYVSVTDPLVTKNGNIIIGATYKEGDKYGFKIMGIDVKTSSSGEGVLLYQYDLAEKIKSDKIPKISQLAMGQELNSYVQPKQELKSYFTVKVKVKEESEEEKEKQSKIMDGLQGYWKFDEDADDSSNNFNNLDNLDNPGVSFEEGKIDNAAYFDGNSYLEILDGVQNGLDTTGNMTVACWVKLNSLTGHSPIVSKYDSKPLESGGLGRSYELVITQGGKVNWVVSANGQDASGGAAGPTNISVGQWYHIAAVRDGGLLRVFVNGVEATGFNWPESYPKEAPIYDSSTPFRIGNGFNSSNYFDGLIDEVAVFDKALTPEEIGYIFGNYTSGLPLDLSQEYLAIGSVLYFTLDNSKLYALACGDVDDDCVLNFENDKIGVLKGYPIDAHTPGFMGAPTVINKPDGTVKVLFTDVKEGIPTVRAISHIKQDVDNDGELEAVIGSDEVQWSTETKPNSVIKSGNISLGYDVDGYPTIIAPFYVEDAEGIKKVSMREYDNNLVEIISLDWGSPYEPMYLEIIPVKIFSVLVLNNYYIFGAEAKTAGGGSKKFTYTDAEGETIDVTGKGFAAADLDGDSILDIIINDYNGYLYIFEYPTATPDRLPWPYYRWIPRPKEENSKPVFVEPTKNYFQCEAGKEFTIDIRAKDDVEDILKYTEVKGDSYTYKGKSIISYSDEDKKLKLSLIPQDDSEGNYTLALKAEDTFSSDLLEITIDVAPKPVPQLPTNCKTYIGLSETTKLFGSKIYTNSKDIKLKFLADNATHVMYSDKEDFSGADWVPFEAKKLYDYILTVDGEPIEVEKKIYPKFKNEAGEVDSNPVPVTYDTKGPSLTYHGIPKYESMQYIVVAGTYQDACPVDVMITANGISQVVNYPSGNKYNASVQLKEGEQEVFTNSIQITAKDKLGNPAVTVIPEIQVILDTKDPIIEFISWYGKYVNFSNLINGKLAITGKFKELNIFSITVNGVKAIITDPTSSFSAQVPLKEGPNGFVVTSIDMVGHEGKLFEIPVTEGVILDTKVPQISIDSPFTNEFTVPIINISGSITEVNPDPNTFCVYVNNVKKSALTDGKSFKNVQVQLKEGLNSIKVEMTDLAKNTGSSNTINVTYKPPLPDLIITEIKPPAKINKSGVWYYGIIVMVKNQGNKESPANVEVVCKLWRKKYLTFKNPFGGTIKIWTLQYENFYTCNPGTASWDKLSALAHGGIDGVNFYIPLDKYNAAEYFVVTIDPWNKLKESDPNDGKTWLGKDTSNNSMKYLIKLPPLI